MGTDQGYRPYRVPDCGGGVSGRPSHVDERGPDVLDDGPGRFSAGLVFRVGKVDEAMATSGITHLVEHLALPPDRPGGGLEPNGWVDLTEARIWADGERDRVLAFLADTAGRLAALPLERFDAERRILEAEEARAGGSARDPLLRRRYGAAGAGLAGFSELGLLRISPRDVQDWASRYFTAANAVFWATGDVSDFELELASAGERASVPVPTPSGNLGLPVGDDLGMGGIVVVSMVVRGSPAATVAAAIAGRRLYTRLRSELGVSYVPYVIVDKLDADHDHVVFAADCLDERAASAALALVETLEELASTGPRRASSPRRSTMRAATGPMPS